MIEFKIFIKSPEKITKMIGMDAGKAVGQAMLFAMKRSTIRLADYIAEHKLSGQKLNVRTGSLRRSLQESRAKKVITMGNNVIGTVGTNLKYAAIHEYGGTIRPKRAKWLAIPLKGALTAKGVARGGPRDFKDTFFATSKKGNLILFGRSMGSIIPLFAMKKEVKIPKKPYMKPSLKEKSSDIIKFFSEDIQKYVEKVWRTA